MNGNSIQEWLNNEKTIAKSVKPYSHFDFKTNIVSSWDYISDPSKVAKHGFYPFIHYEQKQIKFRKKKGKKIKVRNIYYAAHIDSCIYQYYSFLLNEKYNDRVKNDNLSDVAVAYRTDLGKSNIHFAKSAFDFMKNSDTCYIMIGDFTDFFDTLEHNYLKYRICDLMGTNCLPNDYYSVFKNVTKYSYVELTDLLKLNQLEDTPTGRYHLNNKAKVLDTDKFRENKEKPGRIRQQHARLLRLPPIPFRILFISFPDIPVIADLHPERRTIGSKIQFSLHPLRRGKSQHVNTYLQHGLRELQQPDIGFSRLLIFLRENLCLMVKTVKRICQVINI